MAVWDDVLPDTDRKVFEAAGWGRPAGLGRRPVLLLVDVNYNFVGDRPEPILESVKRWRYSCGERGWQGVAAIGRFLERARGLRLPVLYTTNPRRPDGFDLGVWNLKSWRAGDVGVVAGHLYRVGIPEPCVWDRGELTHKVNLFDLHQKYCDVLELEEALGYLDGLEPGLFDAELPVLREDGSVAR